MVDWVSLTIPFVYLIILVGSLATFASVYRARKAARSASLEPWFEPHLQRDIYYSLLHHEQREEGKEKLVTPPDSVLKAALLRRAQEDIRRIVSIRSSKQPLNTLLQKGSVGDDLWQRFLRAEAEMEEELKDVVNEANGLAPGWGQVIFQSANEMHTNSQIRAKVEDCVQQGKMDREWWNRKRAATRSEFMKELGIKDDSAGRTAESARTQMEVPDSVASFADNSPPGTSAGGGGKPSDEDTVLVESGGPSNGGPGEGGGKKKKKKNKK